MGSSSFLLLVQPVDRTARMNVKVDQLGDSIGGSR